MHKQQLFFTIVFYLILVFTQASHFSAWTSYNSLSTEKEFIREDFEDFDDDISIRSKYYGESEYQGSYFIGTEKMKTTNIALYKARHNMTKTNIELFEESGVRVQGKEVLALYLNFDWEYTLFNTYKGTGVITIKATSFDFKKVYEKSKLSPNVNVQYGNFIIDNVEIIGKNKDDEYFKKIAYKSFNNFLYGNFSQILSNDFNKYVQEMYDQSANKPTDIYTKFPYKHLLVDNTMTKPQRNLKKGFINYVNAGVSLNSSFPAYKNVTTWDKFNEDEGSHQIFIHNAFFNGVFTRLLETGDFKFIIDDDKMSDNTTFALEIESMKEFYNSSTINERSNKEEIFINTTVTEATFKTSKSKVQMKFKISMDFKSTKDRETLFKNSFFINLNAEPTISDILGFNIKINPEGTKVTDLEIPSEYQNVNTKVLTNYLEEGFKTYYVENPSTLFDEDYPMGEMMSEIFKVKVISQGLIIIGQTKASKEELLSDKDTEFDKLCKEKEKYAEKIIKFLN